jgi:hypothetical protein
MNFVRFLENHFQELRYEQSKQEIKAPNAFNVSLDSEIKSTHSILMGYRTLMKWLLVPKVLIHYLLAVLGIVHKPEPILINLARQNKEEEEAKKLIMTPDSGPIEIHAENSAKNPT